MDLDQGIRERLPGQAMACLPLPNRSTLDVRPTIGRHTISYREGVIPGVGLVWKQKNWCNPRVKRHARAIKNIAHKEWR